ncbi:biopolymer transporter ExbD [Synechocystis sp. FACHB-383]|uniref:ExbD/TolR family protein n=1 Tax=Synechocystis sp. FACHB-383 TaxID=2692864 RepID=UPI001682D61E|nr:biopolymer transporter ExbD [Synechocystis sp. FACHB-383]MBD2653880.1 biopolymer transporter ExbD [Synechocystis sp. FACHB-383]
MKSRVRGARTPGINLVPMIDVLMSVLTFFVILTMSLTGRVIADLDPPEIAGGFAKEEALFPQTKVKAPNLDVGLNRQGKVLLGGNIIQRDELLPAIATFLETNPQGEVRLTIDGQLNYQQVDNLLVQMVEVGGDRVLLVVRKSDPEL